LDYNSQLNLFDNGGLMQMPSNSRSNGQGALERALASGMPGILHCLVDPGGDHTVDDAQRGSRGGWPQARGRMMEDTPYGDGR